MHREALKQSATDPMTGIIDVGILSTGHSISSRKRRLELVEAVKKLIESKGKAPLVNYRKLLVELRESSNMVNIYYKFENRTNIVLIFN